MQRRKEVDYIMKTPCIFDKYVFRNALDGYSIFTVRIPGESSTSTIGICGNAPEIPRYMPMEIEFEKRKDGKNHLISLKPDGSYCDEGTAMQFLTGLGFDEKTAKKLIGMSVNPFLLVGSPKVERLLGVGHEAFQRLKAACHITDVFALKKRFPDVPILYLEKIVKADPGGWENALKRNYYDIAFNQFGLDDTEMLRKSTSDKEKRHIKAGKYISELRKKTIYQPIQSMRFNVERKIGETITEAEFKEIMEENSVKLDYNNAILCDKLYYNELYIARSLRQTASAKQLFTKEEIAQFVEKSQAKQGIQYHEAQKNAFYLLESTGIKVLTGGPGTGKTTVLNGLISMYDDKYGSSLIQLCAPTGRAAQRMTEATGRPACTIHHLMCTEGRINAKLLVIDEASMIDTDLMAWIMQAVPDGATVLLVGDVDQLPSVGYGQVLQNLLQSGTESRRLARTFRNDGSIVENAYRINEGIPDLILDDQFKVIRPDNMLEKTVEVYLDYLRNGESVFDVQILAPTYKGDAGIAALNAAIQDRINPLTEGKKYVKFGRSEFRTGDKVICLHNNYALGYFNGDIGYVVSIEERTVVIRINDKDIEVGYDCLGELALAYAITVHKSQGSEFKHVIVVLQDSVARNMLQKAILFTAVTRAKSDVIIISEGRAMETCIRSDQKKNDGIMQSLMGA